MGGSFWISVGKLKYIGSLSRSLYLHLPGLPFHETERRILLFTTRIYPNLFIYSENSTFFEQMVIRYVGEFRSRGKLSQSQGFVITAPDHISSGQKDTFP